MGTKVDKNEFSDKIKQSAAEAKNHCEPFSPKPQSRGGNSPTTAAADPRGDANIISRAFVW